LILPYLTEAEDRYSLLASEVIRAIWDGVQMGISLDEFAKLHALISGEARQEIDRVRALMSVLPLASDAYRQFANLFAIVERFGSLQRKAALHSGFMVDAEASLYLFVGPNRKYNFPSETFLARMGLNKEIDNLLRQLDKHPGDLSALRSLARAYHLRSDWVHLHTAAQEILRVAPEDAPALAYLGQSLTYLGRHDEAVQFLENISKTNANPLLKLRLGQALVSRARRTGEPGKLMDAIVRKARLFSEAVRESRHDPVLSRKVRLNLLLDNMSLSDPLCLKGPSVTELQELKGEFDSIKERGLSVLARISLAMARMSIAYALYVIRQKDHHPSAALLRGEIMAIDPDGLLAARSKSARKPVGRKKSARRHRAH
jgi:tetratricopeptide (TPR) repeat protein